MSTRRLSRSTRRGGLLRNSNRRTIDFHARRVRSRARLLRQSFLRGDEAEHCSDGQHGHRLILLHEDSFSTEFGTNGPIQRTSTQRQNTFKSGVSGLVISDWSHFKAVALSLRDRKAKHITTLLNKPALASRSEAAALTRNVTSPSLRSSRAWTSRNGSRRATCQYPDCIRVARWGGSASNTRRCTGTTRRAGHAPA